MVSLDEAGRMALELPEVVQGERHGTLSWSVAGKTFAWERGFSKADLKRFGDVVPPAGPILAVRVDDLGEKEAVLGGEPEGVLHDSSFQWLCSRPDPAEGRHQAFPPRGDHRRLVGLRPQQARRRIPCP